MIIEFLLKSNFERKIDEINETFNSFTNKYIGDGIGAMLIVLALIIIVIVVVRKAANK